MSDYDAQQGSRIGWNDPEPRACGGCGLEYWPQELEDRHFTTCRCGSQTCEECARICSAEGCGKLGCEKCFPNCCECKETICGTHVVAMSGSRAMCRPCAIECVREMLDKRTAMLEQISREISEVF